MLSSHYALPFKGAIPVKYAGRRVIGRTPLMLNIGLIIRQTGGTKVSWSLRRRAKPAPPVQHGSGRRAAGGGLAAMGAATATAGQGGGGGLSYAGRAAKPQILIKIQHIIFKKVRQLESRWLAH